MATNSLAERVEIAAAARRTAPPSVDGATMHLTLARVGAAAVALRVDDVVELVAVQDVSVAPLPHLPPPFAGLVRRRGHLLPVADLSLRLTGTSASRGPSGRLVVCRYRDGDVGLLVDEVTAVTTVSQTCLRDLASSVWNKAEEFVSAVVDVQGNEHLLIDLSRLWQALHDMVPRRGGVSCGKS